MKTTGSRHAPMGAMVVAAIVLLTVGCTTATDTGEGGGARAWTRVPAPGDLPTDRPLRAGFLIVDGVYNSELTAPYDILQHTIFHTEPGIEVFTVSPDGEAVTTFEGLIVTPHFSFADAPPIDILVVPSAEGSMDRDLYTEAMMRWVRETGEQDRFAETFPRLDLERGVSCVHEGRMLTSQGGAKSYDVAMYLVDHLYGEEVARGVGGGLIIAWPPGRRGDAGRRGPALRTVTGES